MRINHSDLNSPERVCIVCKLPEDETKEGLWLDGANYWPGYYTCIDCFAKALEVPLRRTAYLNEDEINNTPT